ncbi:MAG: carbohydrate ABC transporter permease [Candidatus Hodarchaeales archaeon]
MEKFENTTSHSNNHLLRLRRIIRNHLGGDDAGFVAAMLSPVGIVFIIGILFPLLYGLFISFFYILRTPPTVEFYSINNYIQILFYDSDFSHYYWNTLLFTVVTVTFELFLGLIIALLLNKNFKGRGIVRASILIPWAIPTIVNALLWKFIFKADMQGLVNDMLWRLGFITRDEAIIFAGGGVSVPLNLLWLLALFIFPVSVFIVVYTWFPKLYNRTFNFLDNPAEIVAAVLIVVSVFILFFIPQEMLLPGGLLSFTTIAFPSDFIIVFIVDIWKTTPFMALLILAGLQVIPQDLYKAAIVDGATRWQQFRYVTLPLLLPGIGTALIFRTIDAFRVYDILAVFTASNIQSITAYAVTKHSQGYYGLASAIAVFEFLNIIIFTVLFLKLTRRRN